MNCLIRSHKPKLKLNEFFDQAQRSRNCHPRIISSIIKIHRKSDNDIFSVEFLQLLLSTLVQNEKSSHSIKVLEFAAKICCHVDNEAFLMKVIRIICEVSSRKETVVRQRCCEFFHLLLSNMSAQAAIDEDAFNIITAAMLERLQDKLPFIRGKAVSALQRLQDPQDPDCKVVKAFLYHIECDPSSEVRKAVVENIAISQRTLAAIVQRVIDVNDSVRRHVYKTVAKLKVRRFRINQRQMFLINGLNDRSDEVREFVKKHLIPAWFEHCEENYVKLLELLDVESLDMEIVETVLFSLFRKQPSAHLIEIVEKLQEFDHTVAEDKVTPEICLVWFFVVKYFNNPPEGVTVNIEDVSSILPELTYFTNYIRGFVQHLTRGDTTVEFIILRLLEMVQYFSLSDEMGRNEMLSLSHDMLINKEVESVNLISVLAKLLTSIIPDVYERFEKITEIISDIKNPLDANVTVHRKSSHNIANRLDSLRLEEQPAAEMIENDIEENVTPEALSKCMLLLVECIKSKDVKSLNNILRTLEQHVITPSLSNESKYVISLAVTALSILCLLDQEMAQKNFVKFCFLMEDDSCCLSSLEAVFDQLLKYGFESFTLGIKESNQDQVTISGKKRFPLDLEHDESLPTIQMKHLVSRFSTFLESPIAKIRAVASQGLSKLLLSGQLKSPLVFALLISLWFSPDHGQDAYISQPLGLFFNIFSKKVKGAGDIIIESLVPLLDQLSVADSDSQLVLIDTSSVSQMIITLLRPDHVPSPEQGPSYHCRLSYIICDEILRRPSRSSEGSSLSLLVKCFTYLTLTKSDREGNEQLLPKLQSVVQKLSQCDEKGLKNPAVHFLMKINSLWNGGNKTVLSSIITSQNKKVSKSYDNSFVSEDGFEGRKKEKYSSLTAGEIIMEEPDSSTSGGAENTEITPPPAEKNSSNVLKRKSYNSPERISNVPEIMIIPPSPDSSFSKSESDADVFDSPPPPTRKKQGRKN